MLTPAPFAVYRRVGMETVTILQWKVCGTCGVTKVHGEFNKHKRTSDGLEWRCRGCKAEYNAANREAILQQKCEYYAANREIKLGYYRERSESNRTRWSIEDPYGNPEPKGCETCRESIPRSEFHRQGSRHDGLARHCKTCSCERRGVRRRRDSDKVYARDGETCYLCGLWIPREELHIDHIIPRHSGGPDEDWNLAATHESCNYEKGANPFPHPDYTESTDIAPVVEWQRGDVFYTEPG